MFMIYPELVIVFSVNGLFILYACIHDDALMPTAYTHTHTHTLVHACTRHGVNYLRKNGIGIEKFGIGIEKIGIEV